MKRDELYGKLPLLGRVGVNAGGIDLEVKGIRRLPFLCIDGRWTVRWKWLWDCFAGDAETYLGYISGWDGCPWNEFLVEGAGLSSFNYAAPAQYFPKYAGEILGRVQDLGAILEADGIIDLYVRAQYHHYSIVRDVVVGDLFFRDYNRRNRECPIVYSRPMDFREGGRGDLCDNSRQVFFCRAAESCEGHTGLRDVYGANQYRGFWADAIHYFRRVPTLDTFGLLQKGLVKDFDIGAMRVVVYVIGAGSVPRIKINDRWHVIVPGYFPSYGDPYFSMMRGHRFVLGRVDAVGLNLPGGDPNEFLIEHIAPGGDEIGAQVIFVFEWGW